MRSSTSAGPEGRLRPFLLPEAFEATRRSVSQPASVKFRCLRAACAQSVAGMISSFSTVPSDKTMRRRQPPSARGVKSVLHAHRPAVTSAIDLRSSASKLRLAARLRSLREATESRTDISPRSHSATSKEQGGRKKEEGTMGLESAPQPHHRLEQFEVRRVHLALAGIDLAVDLDHGIVEGRGDARFPECRMRNAE